MLYEVRVAADSAQEFADTLRKIADAIDPSGGHGPGVPTDGNAVVNLSRYRDLPLNPPDKSS